MSNRFGDLISRGEGGYNSYNRGTSNGHIQASHQEIDFAQMTLDELQRRQALPSGDPQRIFAVGRYQVIPKTLTYAIADLHLSGDALFSPALQEHIFADYLIAGKRPAISRFIQGADGATLHAALKATCQEWASVEDIDTPGRPYGPYGQQGNRVATHAGDVADALNQMRANYRANLERGLTKLEAWRSVTGQIDAPLEIQVASSTIKRAAKPSHLHSSHLVREAAVSRAQVDSVLGLQNALLTLGYRGIQGHRVVPDGSFGPHTRHALLTFQHAHHLHADGIAGKHTLAALERARYAPLLSEATHPQHALYVQALHGVETLPAAVFADAHARRNVAAALTVAAHAQGLRRIDHVVLGIDAVRVFAVQGGLEDPAHRRTQVDRVQATAQSVEHSSRALELGTAVDHPALAQARAAGHAAGRHDFQGAGQ